MDCLKLVVVGLFAYFLSKVDLSNPNAFYIFALLILCVAVFTFIIINHEARIRNVENNEIDKYQLKITKYYK